MKKLRSHLMSLSFLMAEVTISSDGCSGTPHPGVSSYPNGE